MEGFNPTDTITGTVSPAASYSSPGSSPGRHEIQQLWPPNVVSMPNNKPSDLPSASVATAAKGKGKETVRSYPKYEREPKMITVIACRFCNPVPKDELIWHLGRDGLRAHYEEKHDKWVHRSEETTCTVCGNKYENTKDAKKCKKNCKYVKEVVEGSQ